MDRLIGRIATSVKGRDAGRSFIIVGNIDENYVYICDGILRKLVKPKLKKIKHLKIHQECADGIRQKIEEGKQVFDAEIRSCLTNMGFNQSNHSNGSESGNGDD